MGTAVLSHGTHGHTTRSVFASLASRIGLATVSQSEPDRLDEIFHDKAVAMKETGYWFQAGLVVAWWVSLAASESVFAAFQFPGIGPLAFWAFLIPDLVLIAGGSMLRAYVRSALLEYVVLGAFGYASLYCLNASLLTGGGVLPTVLMLLGLAFNLFLVFQDSLFRNSTASRPLNLAKTLIQVLCMWSVALVAIPYVLLTSFESTRGPQWDAPMFIGATLFVLCGALGLRSAWIMVRDGLGTPLPLDQANRLVITGPYRFVRNPMAIAGIGQGVAVAIMFESWPILIYALLGAVVWHTVVRPVEERDLLDRFGAEYEAYRNRLLCWWPRF